MDYILTNPSNLPRNNLAISSNYLVLANINISVVLLYQNYLCCCVFF